MDKENQNPNICYRRIDGNSDLDDMPDLTDSSETSDQVEEEPCMMLSDNPGTQFGGLYPAPHECFCNISSGYSESEPESLDWII